MDINFLKKLILSYCFFSFSIYAATEHTEKIRTIPLPHTVALTFDDGPHPTFTPQVLDILKKYQIKATFFVVGMNAEKYPDLIKAIYADGHHINSHSQTHPMLTKLSNLALNREIEQPNSIVSKIIGVKPKCLRYPFGASNQHVRDAIHHHGLQPVPMGFNSFDYDRPGTQKIVDWVLKNSYSKQVILLHDGFAKREQTIAALPQIIEGIQKKGLGFSTIC